MSLRAARRARGVVGVLGACLLGGFAATGCAPNVRVAQPSPASETATPRPARISDTVWYISARARIEGRDSRRLSDSLEYGLVVHWYSGRADVLTDGIGMEVVDSVRISRDEFVRELRLAAPRGDVTTDFAILSVHGYSTSLHECWRNVGEAKIRSRSSVPWIAFCWPSNGAGVATPKRGAILDRAYREDSTAAVASQPLFASAVRVALDAVPASRLVLAAHSMGAQLLSGALMHDPPIHDDTSDTAPLRERFITARVRAVVFVAPDVDAGRFVDSIAPAIAPLTTRLVAYTSGRDRMLLLSRQRSGTPRAGLRQRVPLALTELETIDATDGLVAENSFQRIFGTHHSIRRASALLFDLTRIVGAQRSAYCRAALGTASLSASGVWTLTKRRPEWDLVSNQCAQVRPAP